MSIDTYPPQAIATARTVLGYFPKTTDQTGIAGGPTDITGLGGSVYIQSGRTIRFSMHAELGYTDATSAHFFDLWQDGVDVARLVMTPRHVSGDFVMYDGAVVLTPTPGPHAYQVKAQRYLGAGTLSVYGTVVPGAYLLVEDITGGAGGPGPIFLGKVENFGGSQSINTGTPTDITGAVLPINVPPGRMIRLRGKIHVSASGAAGTRARLLIQEGGTVLDGAYMVISGASFGEEMEAVAYVNPTPGAHTYKLTLSRDNGSTAVVIYTNVGDAKTSFVAEDITGTEAPTGAYYEAMWTPVTTFTNSWVNYGGTYTPAAYRKVNDLVYLRGLIKNGTISTPAFNLPVGYRPAWDHHFTALSNSLLAGVRVFQDGRVTPGDPGSNLWIALDGIVFGVT